MARRNPAREQALAAAKAQRRREGNKLSRLRQAGVNVETLDQRKSNAQLEGMSTRQIQAEIRRGERFTARTNSIVAGLNGTPINGATWRQYQRAERVYNEKSEQFYGSIRDVRIPTLNQTVDQYLRSLRETRRDGDYKTFGHLERNVANITGQDALKRLLANMENRAADNYLEREARLQRRIVNKMLARTSNKDLIPLIRSMSDEEIITLSQYTEFLPTLEGSYALAKSSSTDRPEWQSSVYEDNEDTIQALIDWAHERDEASTPTPEQGTDGARSTPTRDRYGRFVKRGTSNPDPSFHRDEFGRFARRT